MARPVPLPRRWRLAALVVVVLAAPGTLGLASAEVTPDDLRREREENRRAAAEVAATLDELNAEDQELVDAIAALDAHIDVQQARVEEAEALIADAEQRAAEARTAAEGLVDEMTAIRDRLRSRAIEMFVAPRADVLDQLDSEDLLEHEIKQSYATEVAGDDGDLIDALRVAEAEKADAERRAEEARAEAEAERADLAARRDELEASRSEVEGMRTELQSRIGEFEALGQEMAAADAAITEEIRQLEEELARQAAAEAEARRLAEEEAARQAAAAEAARQAGEASPAESGGDDGTATASPAPTGSFVVTHRPVPGRVVSRFGPRIHPIFGTSRMHTGLDMDGDTGDPIVAAASGVVLSAGSHSGYGNTVVISHGNGFTTLYAHQSSIAVTAGQTVTGGEVIGYVGSTGWSTGPHLHFEIRVDGVAVDPASYL